MQKANVEFHIDSRIERQALICQIKQIPLVNGCKTVWVDQVGPGQNSGSHFLDSAPGYTVLAKVFTAIKSTFI